MVELKVSVPDWAGEYVQEQLRAGNYSSPDALVTELIEQARAMESDDRLAELIRAGMESGDGEEVNDAWWADVRARVREELDRRLSA
jgi:Arc/MetJ-type ribon-helix-helix transcriptional regulator